MNKSFKNTARFWISHKSQPVRISIAEGEELTHLKVEHHDEGTDSRLMTFHHAGDSVSLDVIHVQNDCDGRVTSHDSFEGHIEEIRACAKGSTKPFEWVPVSTQRRDHRAEAYGY